MSDGNHTTASVKYVEHPDYPGYYIGDNGTVMSQWGRGGIVRQRSSSKRVMLKPYLEKNGYLSVTPYRGDGRAQKRLINVLVLEAFVGPRPKGHVCRHLDGDKTNNRLANLAWGTVRENAMDKVSHGTDWMKGSAVIFAKLNESQVAEIKAELKARRNSMKPSVAMALVARKYGVSPATIDKIARGETWKHVT